MYIEHNLSYNQPHLQSGKFTSTTSTLKKTHLKSNHPTTNFPFPSTKNPNGA